ncbi:response regulator transcription factor [Fructilactobacillus myrtifloralis]|uniref:Response regulator transcription factor n=1 Tax=Fructilactobacillus myrtifloralis TaxID=2940301 RepID=A0ABY5BMB4_9LACO|nr:response regulator transcription factor [Fructilactobacillus myrtifloralis]USS84822.1 response regulator transcription factor [Fructilactobacillus myrtifloralis]
MQHITLVTNQLRLAIELSQAFNDQQYFVDTIDDPTQVETLMQRKQSVGLLWDLTAFPFAEYQSVLSDVRHHYQVPILSLANSTEAATAIFQTGLDDYVPAPWPAAELIARFEQKHRLYQRLKESQAPQSPTKDRLQFADVVIDRQKYKAFRNDQDLGLTPKELKLLLYLIEHAPQVLSRTQLLAGVWGDRYDISETSRMVDIHISHLRDKIEADPKHPDYIQTVRGFGYHFVTDDPQPKD